MVDTAQLSYIQLRRHCKFYQLIHDFYNLLLLHFNMLNTGIEADINRLKSQVFLDFSKNINDGLRSLSILDLLE